MELFKALLRNQLQQNFLIVSISCVIWSFQATKFDIFLMVSFQSQKWSKKGLPASNWYIKNDQKKMSKYQLD